MKNHPAVYRLHRVVAGLLALVSAPLFGQADDYGDTAAAAMFVGVNMPINGVLSSATDIDYFRFVLPAAARVAVYTTGTIDTVGSLRNAADVEIAADDNGGAAKNFWTTQDLAAGTYYVKVSGASGATGSYGLRIDAPVAADDFGDTTATASPVSLGSITTVTLGSPTDVDCFRLSLSSAARVALSTTGSVDTIGSLRNSSDQEMGYSDDATPTNRNFRLVRDLPAGLYFIRVSAYERDMGTFTLRVEPAAAATAPTVSTEAVSGITTTGALLRGNVTGDGDATLTQRGVVYATTVNPTLGAAGVVAVTSSANLGAFTIASGVLLPATHYYARAFATNSVGTGYGSPVELFTLASGSTDDHGNTLATATPVAAGSTTAGALGAGSDADYFKIVLAAAARLTAYTTGGTDTLGSLRDATDTELLSNDNGAGVPNFRLDADLPAGTYYVRVTGVAGATGAYSLVVDTALPGSPSVTTSAATAITASAATIGGVVLNDGGTFVSQRGVVYGTASGPALGGAGALALTSGTGTGSFTFNLTGLKPSTVYYVRAFATNTAGTTYGPQIELATLPVTTAVGPTDDHGDTAATATLIGPNSLTGGVIGAGADLDYFKFVLPVDSPVFIVSLGTTSLVASLRNSDDVEIAFQSGAGGNFRLEQQLRAGTYYLVVYGAPGSYSLALQTAFVSALATVVTAEATAITPRTATLGGEVTNAGGVTVTGRGVVYGTSPNPTVGQPAAIAVDGGAGLGAFTVDVTGLQPNIRYYVRAYATNSAGTAYGNAIELVTQEDDHGDVAAAATAAAVNESIAGVINRVGDVDYFRFVLPGPRHVIAFTSGNVDTFASLRDAADQEFASDDNGGANGNFRLERDLGAGTYLLRVSGPNGAVGAYALRIEASTPPVVVTAAPAAVSAGSAALGGTVSADGGASVTQRGIILSTTPNPTLTNGTVVRSGAGAGSFTEVLNALQPETQYYATAFAVNVAGTSYGGTVSFTTGIGARLTNLSIRSQAGDGAATLIVGFALSGAGAKPLLLRAVGPGLARFGVAGPLDDPFLQLASPQSALVANENWDGSAAIVAASAAVGAFPLAAGSRDAVLLQPLPANSYTLRVGGGNGVALAEIYDTDSGASPKLVNVSTRAAVGTGPNVLIAGFTVAGPLSKNLLVRAVGPALAGFQVAGALADPRLDVFASGSSVALASNDNWGGGAALVTAFARVGAFELPASSRDAAAVLSLPAGSYTVQISGVGNTSGIALLEIYELP